MVCAFYVKVDAPYKQNAPLEKIRANWKNAARPLFA
jgi:hypothetical protein